MFFYDHIDPLKYLLFLGGSFRVIIEPVKPKYYVGGGASWYGGKRKRKGVEHDYKITIIITFKKKQYTKSFIVHTSIINVIANLLQKIIIKKKIINAEVNLVESMKKDSQSNIEVKANLKHNKISVKAEQK